MQLTNDELIRLTLLIESERNEMQYIPLYDWTPFGQEKPIRPINPNDDFDASYETIEM